MAVRIARGGSFRSIIDPLRVAGDEKEGISVNSGLSSLGD